MNTHPLLSIIVTAYNHEKFIAQCLDSILLQETDFLFEIIIGEDDSTDGTRAICRDYAERYPERIRLLLHSKADKIYIDGKPTGRYNFIQCWKATRGKYFTWIDGDDYLTALDKFQKQVDFMEAHPEFMLCYHPVVFVDERGEKHAGSFKFGEQSLPEADILDYASGRISIYKVSCVFRHALEELPDWYLESPVGDVPLYYLIGQQGKIKYIDEPMAAYRIHAGGQYAGINTAQKYEMGLRVRKFIYDQAKFLEAEVRPPLRDQIKLFAYLTAKHYYFLGDREAARPYHQLLIEFAASDPTYWLHLLKLSWHQWWEGNRKWKG